jgi:hypothetical protein
MKKRKVTIRIEVETNVTLPVLRNPESYRALEDSSTTGGVLCKEHWDTFRVLAVRAELSEN